MYITCLLKKTINTATELEKTRYYCALATSDDSAVLVIRQLSGANKTYT